MTTAAPVPVLDLKDLLAGGSRMDAFVAGLTDGLSRTGFFYLKNHGVRPWIIQAAFATLPDFFVGLPLEVRQQYEYPEFGRQRGYTSPGVEKGEHAQVADTKHFFHFPENSMVNVAEVPSFMPAHSALFNDFRNCYNLLLQAVALSLGLRRDYFDELAGNSLLRSLHYPAQDNPETSDQRVEEVTSGGNVSGMCASRHTDINVLTLLLATQPGLELLHEAEWMPMVLSDPNILIVNCGDMLEHLTGGRFMSAQHRVVCEPGKERYSVPFFGHVNLDVSIVPLARLGESDLERFHYETAGEFLAARLEQIGLKDKETKLVS